MRVPLIPRHRGIVIESGGVIMLGKAALLVKSKVAIAALGVLVAGTGGTVALAATGHLPSQRSAASAGQSADNHGNSSNHGHTIGIEGVLDKYDAGARSISVKAQNATTTTTITVITVNAQTKVNGANATQLSDLSANIGHKVQVQAEKQSGGSLVAWKITVEAATANPDPADDSRREVAGTVASVSGTRIVVKVGDGATVTVFTNSKTVFQVQGATGGLSAIKVGAHVEIHDVAQSDGSLLATSVQVEDDSHSANK